MAAREATPSLVSFRVRIADLDPEIRDVTKRKRESRLEEAIDREFVKIKFLGRRESWKVIVIIKSDRNNGFGIGSRLGSTIVPFPFGGMRNSSKGRTNLLEHGEHERAGWFQDRFYDARKPGVKKSWKFLISFARPSSR